MLRNRKAKVVWFVAIGVVMLVLNLAGIGPVGAWQWHDKWWAMLLPFGLAALWWTWSDFSGRTKRLAMARDDARREARREKQSEALGLKTTRRKPR